MVRTFSLVSLAALLAVLISIPDAKSADERPRAAEVDVNSPGPAAAALNESLKDLYLSLERRAVTPGEFGAITRVLHANVAQLAKLDGPIGKLGGGAGDDEALKPTALRHRALAWLHGWASLSRLAPLAPRAESADRERLLGTTPSEPSVLALLLETHAHIATEKEKEKDPLRRRLADPTTFVFDLGFRKPWKADERPDYLSADHGYFILSSSDIVGRPDADAEADGRGLMSLWGIVNLQLDTRRGTNPPTDEGIDLKPLSDWLANLARHPGLASFDAGKTGPGTDLAARLRKMSAFVAVRHEIQKPDVLDGVLTRLAENRREDKKCEHQLLRTLADASAPVGSEALPAAAIWLRYLFLMSYRSESPQVVTGSGNNSPDRYWKKCEFPGAFGAARGNEPTTSQFLRWNRNPAPGHFDRAVDDATRATFGYRVWEAVLPQMEVERLNAATDAERKKAFVRKLKEHTTAVRALEADYLASRVPKVPSPYWIAATGAHPTLLGHLSEDWPGQCSTAERRRMVRDLDRVAGQIRGAADLQQRVLDAYSAPTPAELAELLRGLSTHLGGAEWDVTAFPTRSVAAYQKEVEEALKDLEKELDRAGFRRGLLDRYLVRRTDADVRELEYASARLGVKIAEKGQQLAATLARVAELNLEIARLTREAAELSGKAAEKDAEAASKRLVLAQRVRDLAAVQVDALVAAQARASEIIKQAAEELEYLRPKLLDVAQQIEDSKKTSLISILRAVVKIVGLVLAPFTEGLSLSIAMAVDQGLVVVEKIGQIDWNNPLKALAQLGDVVDDVGRLGDLTIGKWGGEGTKKAWADVKAWVKARKDDLTKLEGEAKKLLEYVKNLAPEEFKKVAGALANAAVLDLPVELDPTTGTIKIDLGKAGIKLTNPAFAGIWRDVLQNGGMIAADVRTRVEKWGGLSTLADAQLKVELEKAIDDLVQTLPPALVKDIKAAEAAVAKQRERLKKFAKDADETGRRLLAQVLTGNLVVVIDAKNELLAVDRAVAKELADARVRLRAAADQVFGKEIKDLVGRIKGHSDALNRAVTQAQDARDEDELRKIAVGENGTGGVAQTIEAVKKEINDLDRQLELARGQLRDAETGVEVAQLKLDGEKLRAEAAAILIKIGVKKEEAEKYQGEVVRIQQEIAVLRAERAAIDLEAAVRRLAGSRAALERSYSECLRWGVNPLDGAADEGKPEPPDLADVLGHTDVRSASVAWERARLRLACESAVGLLRWLRLVGHASPGAGDVPGRVLKHYATVAAVASGSKSPDECKADLNAVVADVVGVLKKAELSEPYFASEAFQPDKTLVVEWMTGKMTGEQRDAAFRDVPAGLRHRIVGRARLRVTAVEPTEKEVKVAGFAGYKLEAKDRGYLGLPHRAVLVCRQDAEGLNIPDYSVYVVPPAGGRVSSRVPVWGGLARPVLSSSKILKELSEAEILKHSKDALAGLWDGQELKLAPAVGVWTVYIVADEPAQGEGEPEPVFTEDDRVKRAKRWKDARVPFQLRIPLFEFPLLK